MKSKRIISLLLSLILIIGIVPVQVFAAPTGYGTEQLPVDSQLELTNTLGELGGYLAGNTLNTSKLYSDRLIHNQYYKFAFAAENGNNLIDRIKGMNATVVGGDNAANGADRKILNRDGSATLIQTKYHQTASKSVADAFGDDGYYRYVYDDGKPMQLEVPKDQYDDAVKAMRRKIEAGKVKGVSDPDEATKIIRKGNLTFKQAENIAKAGNIDSLTYDAANGVVAASCAAGISFVIDYASCILNGLDQEDALKNAGLNGIKTGGVVFATYIISSQLAKSGVATSLSNALIPTAAAITKTFGDDVCKAILQRAGVEAAGKVTARQMADVMARELIADGVMLVVLTSVDVAELFRGRISQEEVLKNLTVTIISLAAGTAGGVGGAALGGLIVPGAGAPIGAAIGAMLAGSISAVGVEALIAPYYESDAEEMFNIISEQFAVLCVEYLINEDEGTRIVEELKGKLVGDVLKDMFASDDRNQFARELMEPLFVEEVQQRPTIIIPTMEELRYEMKEEMQGIVFIH